MRRKGVERFDSRAGVIDGCGLFLRVTCPSQRNPGKGVNAADMRCRNADGLRDLELACEAFLWCKVVKCLCGDCCGVPALGICVFGRRKVVNREQEF